MKKVTAFLVVTVLVLMCVLATACFYIPHDHDFGDNYFMYTKCKVLGCSVYGRNVATEKYFSVSDYTLDAQVEQIEENYGLLVDTIDNDTDYDTFETYYAQYYDDVDFVVAQYELAYLLSDVYASFMDKYFEVATYYDMTVARYYLLFERIYNSSFKDYFYGDWSEDEIEEILAIAKSYGDSDQDQSEYRTIISEYNDLLAEIDDYDGPTSSQYSSLNALYGRFVTVNNAVAENKGYGADSNKNYMDYAYANVYYREYTPSEVTAMRAYVKNVIAPIFVQVAEDYYDFYYDYYYGTYFNNYKNSLYFEGLTFEPVVTTQISLLNLNNVQETVNYIGDYYNYLSEVSGIDFFGEVNKLYQNGNYFTGTGVGAYTTVINGTPIVYFENEDYSNAFTFVHEFGHYYDFVCNGSLTASMDHSETQSQGDEMLFLAWLANNKTSRISRGYDAVELSTLFDFLSTIILSTAVDEFEQAAYSGKYNGASISDYNKLFSNILATYSGANEYLNTDYWFYVVFDSAAYYISYAMSALPALEIYAKAQNNGLDSARESYLKLFTYSNNNNLVGTDSYGDKTVTANYEQILNWCGLHSAFQSELYSTIQSYFNSRN